MSKRSTEAQARAAADRAYLDQMRRDPAPAQGAVHPVAVHPVDGQPGAGSAALPTPAGPAPLEPTEVMPHVPTAAPSPPLGVSPILGDQMASSAPPVGSFQTPPLGPPGPAFPSQTASAAADTAAAVRSAQLAATTVAEPEPPVSPQASSGMGPGQLRKVGSHRQTSVVEQDPIGMLRPTSVPLQQSPPQQSPPQYSTPEYPSPLPMSPPGLDLPLLLGPNGILPTGDLVTCPECGEMATVDAARRDAQDFCQNCDFPLFWARSTVVLPSGQETGASLRRLPGTVGRAATAALLCPHCGEPNSPAAQTCVRCLLSLHPVEPPPPPVPVYFAPVPPPPEPEPVDRQFPLWWVLLVAVCVLAIVAVVVWILAT